MPDSQATTSIQAPSTNHIPANTILLGLISLITFSLGIGLIIYAHTHQPIVSVASPASTQTTAITQPPTLKNLDGGTPFISTKLGVGFNYEKVTNGNISRYTQETGNRLYIYEAGAATKVGESVQVLSKDPSDSLVQAIDKVILKGYNPADCPINGPTNDEGAFTTAGYITAAINYASNNTPEPGSTTFISSKCPLDYTVAGSTRFFIYDPQHPSKFMFVDGGNAPLYASQTDKTYLWYNTLQLF